MATKILFQVPYLRTSRSFLPDLHLISIEMNKAYIDIANAVNLRTIGLFSTKYAAITGENWTFDDNKKQQSIRQLFVFDSTASIPHGLDLNFISRFTRCFGEYTDGTNWYGIISGTSVAIAGQISFYITPTDIVFLVGAGAPALTQGTIVIEWLSNV